MDASAEGAWIIVSVSEPHWVVRVSAKWSSLTGLKSQDVLGQPLKDFMVGRETETKVLHEFIGALSRGDKDYYEHSVLTLYKGPYIDDDEGPHSLFSLHTFPIRDKRPRDAAAGAANALPARDGLPGSPIVATCEFGFAFTFTFGLVY
jgi:PAS domain-containing protein